MNRRSIVQVAAILVPSIAVLSMGLRSNQDSVQKKLLIYYNEELAKKHVVMRGFRNINEQIGTVVEDVSLIKLIVDPVAFHGKMIRVKGYLWVGHQEDNAIYLSKEDSDFNISKNGFSVDIVHDEWKKYNANVSEFKNKYVTIEGTFDKDSVGIAGSFSGGFSSIWYVGVISTSRTSPP